MNQFTVVVKCQKCKKAVILELDSTEIGERFFGVLLRLTKYAPVEGPNTNAFYCPECQAEIKEYRIRKKNDESEFMAGQ